jgi:hypothetical protein
MGEFDEWGSSMNDPGLTMMRSESSPDWNNAHEGDLSRNQKVSASLIRQKEILGACGALLTVQ